MTIRSWQRTAAAVVLALATMLVAGCASDTPQAPQRNAQQVMSDLAARVGPAEPSTVYTGENDPNKLLGRPGQYTSAASFSDSRVPEENRGVVGSVESGGKVEVFSDAEGAQNRANYIAALAKQTPIAAEWAIVSGPILVRLSRALSQQQVDEYQRALG